MYSIFFSCVLPTYLTCILFIVEVFSFPFYNNHNHVLNLFYTLGERFSYRFWICRHDFSYRDFVYDCLIIVACKIMIGEDRTNLNADTIIG